MRCITFKEPNTPNAQREHLPDSSEESCELDQARMDAILRWHVPGAPTRRSDAALRRPRYEGGPKFSAWERIDTDAKVCRTTLRDNSRGGPRCDMVFRSITFDINTGELLYDGYSDTIEALHDK